LGTENFKINPVLIYPNPTNNVWNFSSLTEKVISFELYDCNGKRIKSSEPNDFNFSLDGSSLSRGLYFGKIATTSFSKSVKLVKL
jgi:hypothetical protein